MVLTAFSLYPHRTRGISFRLSSAYCLLLSSSAFISVACALQSSSRIPSRASEFLRQVNMSEHGKCPMGNHPWIATFFVLVFLLVFAAHKLGLL
jgi:hypothetical protein